jgi:DNA-binding response OmpR family regulator
MADVLLVEDSSEVTLAISSILKGICHISCASNLAEAKVASGSKKFDLVLIDLNLPDGSGFNLISALGELNQRKPVPFLFISGDVSTETQIAGFSMGAEDYITKPFNPFILRARVLNCLRRLQHGDSDEITLGNLVICQREFRAFSKLETGNRKGIDLTTLEFRLLSVFGDHVGDALNRQRLIDLAWGTNTNVIDRVVDQHIFSLRKKLKDTGVEIRSLYGYGYRLEVTLQAASILPDSPSSTSLPGRTSASTK